MEDVTFEYRPTGAGWAAVAFGIGRGDVDLAVSHASGPLDALLRAMLGIAGGQLQSEVYWEAIDGDRYWWEITGRAEGVHVEIVRLWAHRTAEAQSRGFAGQQGGSLFAGDCSVTALCRAVFDGLMRTYFEIGAAGYERLTSSAFPNDALDELEEFLSRVTP